MSEFIIAIIFFILGSIVTWCITNRFYKESKKDLEAINGSLEKKLTSLTKELNSVDRTNTLAINEERIEKAVQVYRRKGSPESIIDSFNDLNNEEKAEMFDAVFMCAKGRLAKNNPFKNR